MVCEKTDYKKPSIMRCLGCSLYTPYLSITELAKREKERYKHFLQRPKFNNCKNCGKIIKSNNKNIDKCRTNCNNLLEYIQNNVPIIEAKETVTKRIIQKRLI